MQSAFDTLVESAQACRRCPAMEGRRRVLSHLNGLPDARILFIAEAPGRLGGERSGRPLVDDASGRHFTALLQEARLDRSDIFITNTVLCNPQDGAGRNRKPTRAELDNCRDWLSLVIAQLDPPLVVTLGSVALDALAKIEFHDYRLRTHVRRPVAWAQRTLLPLYHPSPLTRASRSDALQIDDYYWLGAYVRERGLLAARTE